MLGRRVRRGVAKSIGSVSSVSCIGVTNSICRGRELKMALVEEDFASCCNSLRIRVEEDARRSVTRKTQGEA